MKKQLAAKITGIALSATVAFSGIAAAQTAVLPIDTNGSYAKDTINHLYSAGILHGVDTKHYKPKAMVTRAEFVAMIDRALQLPLDSSKTTSYTDLKGWAVPYVDAAHDYAILDDLGTTQFHPSTSLLVEEAASIMVDALEKIAVITVDDKLEVKDADKVGAWAKHEADVALEFGLIQAKKDGLLHPISAVTREDAAVMISNFLKTLEWFKAHKGQGKATPPVPPAALKKNVSNNNTVTTGTSSATYNNTVSTSTYVPLNNNNAVTQVTYSQPTVIVDTKVIAPPKPVVLNPQLPMQQIPTVTLVNQQTPLPQTTTAPASPTSATPTPLPYNVPPAPVVTAPTPATPTPLPYNVPPAPVVTTPTPAAPTPLPYNVPQQQYTNAVQVPAKQVPATPTKPLNTVAPQVPFPTSPLTAPTVVPNVVSPPAIPSNLFWDPNTAYLAGDEVIYQGKTYKAYTNVAGFSPDPSTGRGWIVVK